MHRVRGCIKLLRNWRAHNRNAARHSLLRCACRGAAATTGGHLNPAVTISTLLCGFYPILHSILYIILQVRHMR